MAFATQSGSTCKLDKITVMMDWGANMDNLGKVPSVISYSPEEDEKRQWGSDISDNAVSMVHTKLELGMQDVLGELDMTIQVLDGMKNLSFMDMVAATGPHDRPAYSEKSPEEIVADYLTKVYGIFDDKVDADFTDAFRKLTATDLVVTVPTVCSSLRYSDIY